MQSADDRTRSIAVMTDAGGHFEIKAIEPGHYTVTVIRNGFVPQEYGQRKPNGPGAILTLRPGQQMKDLQFRMIPSGVIAGRIVDEDGEPLSSVMVSALREVYSEGKRSFSTSAFVQTNDLGEYRLFGLSPGRYFVSAVYPRWGRFGRDNDDGDSPDSQQEGYAKIFYPGTADRSRALPLSLKSGEEIPSIEIAMRQVVVYHVREHVYNQITRKPGTQTNIFLLPKKRGLEFEFGSQAAEVERNDGAFDLPEVLPGSYVLTAMWSDEGKTYTTRVSVEVGNANVDGVTLTIGAGVNVAGRIIWDGKPSLENGELTVNPRPDVGWNFWGTSARVDPANSFLLKDMGDGTYFAEISGESKDCYIKDVRYGTSSALDDGFTVSRGTAETLEITVSSRGARVQGSVTDADELPAAGMQVVLVPEESRRSVHRLYKSVTTDQYGHFDVRGVAPGAYKLFSWEEVEAGAWEDPEFLKTFEDQGERISVEEGDQKTLKVTAIRTKAPESPKP